MHNFVSHNYENQKCRMLIRVGFKSGFRRGCCWFDKLCLYGECELSTSDCRLMCVCVFSCCTHCHASPWLCHRHSLSGKCAHCTWFACHALRLLCKCLALFRPCFPYCLTTEILDMCKCSVFVSRIMRICCLPKAKPVYEII